MNATETEKLIRKANEQVRLAKTYKIMEQEGKKLFWNSDFFIMVAEQYIKDIENELNPK